ncbi:MAG: molybdenum cofactor biosynthesis protein MoaE [Candidatus Eremiobacteraeota bacterium]|nr:molybdenum cofactor biosynthesis protein MoaE [Candidatus Eremiobacteraeota bacterium]
MIRLQSGPIDARDLEAAVRSDACGGIVTFLGIVRNRAHDGRDVDGLEYEAHEEMALAEFETIASEVRERFPGVRLAIVHRTGALAIGETAVAVCAAAPHRSEAFDACEYAIDELKARAPIWKKERYTDGSGEWIANAC